MIVGGGSAGAAIAARLSEDPNIQICLVEAGGEPPEHGAMPAAVASMQNVPETDWMYKGDPGGAGKGLVGNTMMVPRGKMLGGSSGINYMAYVRGHHGDFDRWAEDGADGWSYEDVLPYFKKSEGLIPSDDIVVDEEAHNTEGPLGVSVRQPVLKGSKQFVEAAGHAGIPEGDYNGRDRGGPEGLASLFQTTTQQGRRSSTYYAFFQPIMERDNLTILTHARTQRVLFGQDRATGVHYRSADGTEHTVHASREVVLSAGSIGSPHLLMLSGVGPKDQLEKAGIPIVSELPDVGQHLQDHLHVPLFFEAPDVGEKMLDIAMSMGPDALREPNGPLPANPADDEQLPEQLRKLKAEAERQLTAWATTGEGIPSSSLYDATTFYSTGLGDAYTHDAQIAFLACGYTPAIWENVFRVRPDAYFEDAEAALDPTKGVVVILPTIVKPRSEGAVTLQSADPMESPHIALNYYDDPHDMEVMISIMRRSLEIAENWPNDGLGDWLIPPDIAAEYDYTPGDDPSDELLEALARHFSLTVYHETSTCRIGEVVDPTLKVHGLKGLRVADASVMPTVVSGNTNAASIMIGEKAAEMIAAEHGVTLQETVGT